MHAIVIGPEQRARIAEIIAYSDAHTFPYEELVEASKGRRFPAGDNPEHVMDLQVGYRVVFSYENQKQGRARHISVSHESGLPSVIAFNLILSEFGFRGRAMESDLYQLLLWQESKNVMNALEMEDP